MRSQNKLSSVALLVQATCAVLVNGQITGTAWLVSDDGLLVTAGHILGKETPLDTVEIRFPEDAPLRAHKLNWGFQPTMGIDFAILKIDDWQANRQPLPIALSQEVDGEFILRGYGVTFVDQSGGKGTFLGPFDPQNSQSNRMFVLRSSEIGEGGYSGAAVFSEKLGAVVAVQVEATTKKTGPHRDTILSMPLYRIASYWDQLKKLAKDLRPYDDLNEHDDADYEYDIMLSYANDFSGPWIRKIFYPLFDWFLQDFLGRPVTIEQVSHLSPRSGDYTLNLRNILNKSRCLVPIWSTSYFNSSWCLFECCAMLERERLTGYGTSSNPVRLAIPVLASDCIGFPSFTQNFPDPLDCRDYIVPPSIALGNSDAYFTFRNNLAIWVQQVIEAIKQPPTFQKEWFDLTVEIPEMMKPKCKQPTLSGGYQTWAR